MKYEFEAGCLMGFCIALIACLVVGIFADQIVTFLNGLFPGHHLP